MQNSTSNSEKQQLYQDLSTNLGYSYNFNTHSEW